jgi:hypothetical protein
VGRVGSLGARLLSRKLLTLFRLQPAFQSLVDLASDFTTTVGQKDSGNWNTRPAG